MKLNWNFARHNAIQFKNGPKESDGKDVFYDIIWADDDSYVCTNRNRAAIKTPYDYTITLVHARSGAPDVALAIRHRIVVALASIAHVAVALMVGGVEKKREGHLKDIGHFERIGIQFKWRLHPADHRRHAKPRGDVVFRKPADDFHPRPAQAGFFLRLPQRSGNAIGVTLVDPSAGKADLAGVIVQMRGALGKHQRQATGLVDYRYQYGGWHRLVLGRVDVERKIRVFRRAAMATQALREPVATVLHIFVVV